MKLGFCSNAFTRVSLEHAIDEVAKCGYAAIELLCDKPHYWPPDESEPRRSHLATKLEEHGLAAANINANTACGYYPIEIPENVFGPALCSPNEEDREQRRSHIEGALQLASAVGATCVSITSGYLHEDQKPERARAVLCEQIALVLSAAEAHGIRIGLEAEPGLLLERSDEVASIIQEMNHPLLGFNLDVGHAVVIGEDPVAIIDAHADRVWHLHLEDIAGLKHYHLIPGEGDIDFASIATALRRNGFAGYASIEIYPYKEDPTGAASLAWERLAALFD